MLKNDRPGLEEKPAAYHSAVSDSQSLPERIVAIGASAGGLEALDAFFEAVPPDSRDAYIVVQHLSRDFESHMDSLLARKTSLPIATAEQDDEVKANHIYLIPRGTTLEIEGYRLKLKELDPKVIPPLPINVFFHSLADSHPEKAVAVILSGSGSDGTDGAMAIHHAGGRVIVQDPRSAQFDSMPQSVIKTGIFDLILRPNQMADAILDLGQGSPVGIVQDKTRDERAAFVRIMALLNDAYAVDFSVYKPATIIRRIERRLQIDQIDSIEDYADRLASNVEELDKLYEDLLIGVTQFFRDPLQFACLEAKIVPELIKQGMAHGEIRVWVAGCASGEEAYSIAMLLDEATSERDIAIKTRIFATDIHGASLHRAMVGHFGKEAVAELSPERLRRHFSVENGGFHIRPALKEMVLFTRHNVVQDPPFTNMDLVTCRNLLIYLDNEAQENAIARLHFALRDRGHLFLGNSERPGRYKEEFDTVAPQTQLFRKRRDVRLIEAAMLVESKLPASLGERRRIPIADTQRGLPASLSRAYDFLLNKVVHRGFLIDSDGAIHHTFGDAGRYTPLTGAVQTNLLDLVDERLRPALHTTLLRARRSEASERSGYIQVDIDGVEERLRIEAQAMPPDQHGRRMFLILISPEEVLPANVDRLLVPDGPSQSIDEVTWLRQELIIARQSLDNLMQEVGTRNEELQAANEELTTANEELQSTNEELQSVNEELYTVNNEYQKKILELQNTTDDLNNLIRSTEIGVIFTDEELNIRRFTPKATEFLNLIDADIGRPLRDISPRLKICELTELAGRITQEGKVHEEEVRSEGGHWYLMRILPYRGKGKVVEGVILAFIDIDKRKAAEEHSKRAEERFDLAIRGVGLGIWDLNIESSDLYLSDQLAGMLRAGDKGFFCTLDDFSKRFHPEDAERVTAAIDTHLEDGALFSIQYRLRRNDGSYVLVESRGTAMRGDDGRPIRFVGVIDDLSLRQKGEQALSDVQTFAELAKAGPWAWTTDENHCFTYVSEGSGESGGWRADEIIGKTFRDVASADIETDPWRAYLDQLNALKAFRDVALTKLDRDGQLRHLVLSGEPQFDQEQRFIGYRGVGRDVTSIRRQLEQSSKAVDDFAYIASHDLRAPLRAIAEHVDSILDENLDQLDDQVVERLKGLAHLSGRMEKLVSDLLFFSRIGRYQQSIEAVDLHAVVEGIEVALADRIRDDKVTITKPRSLPILNGYKPDLSALFQHLIDNAITFNDSKKKAIEIGLAPSIDRGDKVETNVFFIRDNGIGIDEDCHDEVFRIFKRLHGKSEYGDGTGAGLSFVKKIVENHDGKIWLDSSCGEGTTFFFTLNDLQSLQQ